MRINAKWTNDCCGKKDFDGDIVSISTRYWPAGGGYMFLNTDEPNPELRDADDGSKPSATSQLLLIHRDDEIERATTLIEQDFEGETLEEVQAQVEQWAQAQMDRLVGILKEHYRFKKFY